MHIKDSRIPQIIIDDATSKGFENVRYGGEHDGIPYFVYEKKYTGRYSGLPCVAKIVDGEIELTRDLSEVFKATNFTEKPDKQ